VERDYANVSSENGRFAGGLDLSTAETRVLGCLLEKQRTTPELYPLTLNSLRSACNQSTSRDPVVEYDDAMIRDALHHLERRGFTRLASGQGSRAPKYRHLLAEALPMDGEEQALMCVLMLRGAQTPGELKQRVERLRAFPSLDAVHETLERLIGRGLAARLPRRPGQKEERYAQLIEAEPDSAERAEAPARNGGDHSSAASVLHAGGGIAGEGPQPGSQEMLEARVARLEHEVAELRAALDGQAAGGVE
jgi:uncharacterized protein YceH (UPF0502 family)